MSFRFFATPTVVFRSSRLGEDFSKFPESSYRSSKKKLKIVLTMTHTPTTTWWRKRVIWFTFYPIAFIQTTNTGFVPFLSSSCPPTHFYFLPTHNALIGCFIKWPKKTPVNWSVVLCGQNEVKSAKKKRLIDFLRLCLGALKAVSANITFSSRLRATYYCACHPKNQYFQIVPYLCCFWDYP